MEFTTKIVDNLFRNQQIHALYSDIAKAFDSVNVELLHHKLRLIGTGQQLPDWQESVLEE